MKTRTIAIVTVALVSTIAQAYQPIGVVDWVHHCGGAFRDTSQDMCGTADGSFYITGWFEVLYEPDLPEALRPRATALRDIFLSKYDRDGQLLWARGAGSYHCDVSGGVAALDDGTCAITGSYGYGTANCLFGAGTPIMTLLKGIGLYDVCVAKYDGDGALQWAKRAGGDAQDYGDDIALAPDGSVFVSGYSYSGSITFDPELPTAVTLVNPMPGGGFYFLARYAADGTFQWAKPIRAARVVALSDGGCVCHTHPGLVRFSEDGTELWSDDTLATDYAALATYPGNEFVVASGQGETHVTRYLGHEDGTVSQLWDVMIPDCFVYSHSPISVRSNVEGPVTFGASGKICTVAGDGSWFGTGPLNNTLSGLYSLPDSNYCYLTGGFYSNTTVGNTTLAHRGSGDFFIARATSLEQYRIRARCEGPGWVQFNSADGMYWQGESVVLTAMPVFPGVYEFAEWGDDFAGVTDPEITFASTEDKEVVAVFEHVDGAPQLPATSFAGLVVLMAALATGARFRIRK